MVNLQSSNVEYIEYEEHFSQNVIDNTLLDPCYFICYIQYLFKKNRDEEVNEWLTLANYIKMPQKVEYMINYYVCLVKLKEIYEVPDDEENVEILAELFEYFENECEFSDIKYLVGLSKNIKEFLVDGRSEEAHLFIDKISQLYSIN